MHATSSVTPRGPCSVWKRASGICRWHLRSRLHRQLAVRHVQQRESQAGMATVAVQPEKQHCLVLTELSPTRAPTVFRVGGSASTASNGTAAVDVGVQEALSSASHGPLATLKAIYLPEGFPASVTDDYLPYQLVSVPCHITGWLSHSLATSSLLKAVGVDAGAVGAVAVSAAIKWIIKDGIGAAGRFLVGGRLGREFDDDPRRWRMVAEAITSLGLALEISTSLYPQHFLILASTGNFAKALAKGMGKPVFRVVQTHFAATGNVGAVAAKEEVWEVSAQLAGYAASVALLQALEGTDSWVPVVSLWAGVQAVHVALRYAALSQLRFATLNQKRACALAAQHVAAMLAGSHSNGASSSNGHMEVGSESDTQSVEGQQVAVVQLPGVAEVNAAEPMLIPATSLKPRVHLGCSLQQAWGGVDVWGGAGSSLPGGVSDEVIAEWVSIYSKEDYLLLYRDGAAWVVVKKGASQWSLMRAVWQAAWLDAQSGIASSTNTTSSNLSPSSLLSGLRESLAATQLHHSGFMDSMAAAGWDLTVQPVLQVQQTRLLVQGDEV